MHYLEALMELLVEDGQLILGKRSRDCLQTATEKDWTMPVLHWHPHQQQTQHQVGPKILSQ